MVRRLQDCPLQCARIEPFFRIFRLIRTAAHARRAERLSDVKLPADWEPLAG